MRKSGYTRIISPREEGHWGKEIQGIHSHLICGCYSFLAGDLSTLTSHKDMVLKPAPIFPNHQFSIISSSVLFSFPFHNTFHSMPNEQRENILQDLVQQNIVMSHKWNPKAEEELSLMFSHYLADHSLPLLHVEDPLSSLPLNLTRG